MITLVGEGYTDRPGQGDVARGNSGERVLGDGDNTSGRGSGGNTRAVTATSKARYGAGNFLFSSRFNAAGYMANTLQSTRTGWMGNTPESTTENADIPRRKDAQDPGYFLGKLMEISTDNSRDTPAHP